MQSEMGEYIVGAYLQIVEECNFVVYNVKPKNHKFKGLDEIDVVGLKCENGKHTVFICEVATHLDGLLYGNNTQDTVKKCIKKFKKMKNYTSQYPNFDIKYMFWSPVVSPAIANKIINNQNSNNIEFIINDKYKDKLNELIEKANSTTTDTGNPAFRLLQILLKSKKFRN